MGVLVPKIFGVTRTFSYNPSTNKWEFNQSKSQIDWTIANCSGSSLSIGGLDFGYPSTECSQAFSDASGKDVYVFKVVYETPLGNTTVKNMYTTYTYSLGNEYRTWYNPSTGKVWGNLVTK
jgi:hypothetical protein